jgi:hypothetical protein
VRDAGSYDPRGIDPPVSSSMGVPKTAAREQMHHRVVRSSAASLDTSADTDIAVGDVVVVFFDCDETGDPNIPNDIARKHLPLWLAEVVDIQPPGTRARLFEADSDESDGDEDDSVEDAAGSSPPRAPSIRISWLRPTWTVPRTESALRTSKADGWEDQVRSAELQRARQSKCTAKWQKMEECHRCGKARTGPARSKCVCVNSFAVAEWRPACAVGPRIASSLEKCLKTSNAQMHPEPRAAFDALVHLARSIAVGQDAGSSASSRTSTEDEESD